MAQAFGCEFFIARLELEKSCRMQSELVAGSCSVSLTRFLSRSFSVEHERMDLRGLVVVDF